MASLSPNHVELLEQIIVDLGKQIQELKVQINHLSSAQGEETEIQYSRGAENSEIGVRKQDIGIS